MVAVDYDYPWDNLIARFKFRNEPGWANSFASMLIRAPGAGDLLQCSNFLVPVPLTTHRLATRGFNQAWELAKALRRQAAERQLPAPPGMADALLRIGEAPDQHSLQREQRLRNLQTAFVTNPARMRALKGSQILLVDDVATTGTTLQRAANALLMGGANGVTALTFARAAPQ